MAFVVIYALTWAGDVVIVFMLAAGETIPFGVTLYDLSVNMSGLWNALAYRRCVGSRPAWLCGWLVGFFVYWFVCARV